MDSKSDKSAVPSPASRPSLFGAAPAGRPSSGGAKGPPGAPSLLSAIERVDGSPARPAGSRRSPWSAGLVMMLGAAALLAVFIALGRKADAVDTPTPSADAAPNGTGIARATGSAETPAAPERAQPSGPTAAPAASTQASAPPPELARLETLPNEASREPAPGPVQPATAAKPDAGAQAQKSPPAATPARSAGPSRPASAANSGASLARAPATAATPSGPPQRQAAERKPPERIASAQARELIARAEVLEGRGPTMNRLPSPSAAPQSGSTPQRDPDVELLAAMMQHLESGAGKTGAAAAPADQAAAGAGATPTIAQLVQRCSTLPDRTQRPACLERICEGYWGKAQACPAPTAKPRASVPEPAR